MNDVAWQEIHPEHPYYFFVPKNFSLKDNYFEFKALDEIFKTYTSGVVTHRDDFVVAFTEAELDERLQVFTSNESDEEIKTRFKLRDTRDWNFKKARAAFKRLDNRECAVNYAYRPFDVRKICYTPLLVEYPREKMMGNLLPRTEGKRNIALVSSKLLSGGEYRHAFVTEDVTDKHILSIKSEKLLRVSVVSIR
ncbi:MAG: type ISP restriction/modification enzyme [Halobacteriota archaeon]